MKIKVNKIKLGLVLLNILFFIFDMIVLIYKYKTDSIILGSVDAFIKYLPYAIVILLLEELISLFTLHSDIWQ